MGAPQPSFRFTACDRIVFGELWGSGSALFDKDWEVEGGWQLKSFLPTWFSLKQRKQWSTKTLQLGFACQQTCSSRKENKVNRPRPILNKYCQLLRNELRLVGYTLVPSWLGHCSWWLKPPFVKLFSGGLSWFCLRCFFCVCVFPCFFPCCILNCLS